MANFYGNRMGVSPIGQITKVPDNDLARLMYYLSCVDTVIDYNEIDKLSDFKNYYLLNLKEIEILLKLVLLYNPKFFFEQGIFIIDPSLLPSDSDNEFYQIEDERIKMHVNDTVLLGGRTVKVLKVMVCNQIWLERNYYGPLKRAFNKELPAYKPEIQFIQPQPQPVFVQPVYIAPSPVVFVGGDQPVPFQNVPRPTSQPSSCPFSCCCF